MEDLTGGGGWHQLTWGLCNCKSQSEFKCASEAGQSLGSLCAGPSQDSLTDRQRDHEGLVKKIITGESTFLFILGGVRGGRELDFLEITTSLIGSAQLQRGEGTKRCSEDSFQ